MVKIYPRRYISRMYPWNIFRAPVRQFWIFWTYLKWIIILIGSVKCPALCQVCADSHPEFLIVWSRANIRLINTTLTVVLISKFQGGAVALLQDSEEGITRLERRLYFQTAHGHFKAGCPALALEVLSKLPERVRDEKSRGPVSAPSIDDTVINTGQFGFQPAAKSTTISRYFVRRCAVLFVVGLL